MFWLLWLPVTLAAPRIFPLVDPGLFVISGVSTCGEGGGYCLLGLDCTLDEDFVPDLGAGQHCEGLRSAFTPSAHFVCCRAANNRSTSKAPIVLPSVPTTEKSTTLSILENEIDQVVLKVAQSVDSVKTVTQKSEEKEDDNSGETMMADSPVVGEGEDDVSSEEEDTGESEEETLYSISLGSDSLSEVTESSSSEEESSTHKMKASENLINKYQESGVSLYEGGSELNKEMNPESKENMTEKEDQTENMTEKEDHIEQISENYDDKSSNFIGSEENLLESISLKDAVLQNEIIHETVAKDSTDEDQGIREMLETDTSKQGLLSDQVTPKNQIDNGPETIHPEISSAPLPPTSSNSKDNVSLNTSSTINNTNENKIVMSTTNKTNEINNVENNNNGKNKTAQTDGVMENSTPNNPTQTINTSEDRLGTTTTVSPDSDNGQIPPMGEATQGHPKPCSRNCSEQVRFEFQNQPFCFGSMFSENWIVTSASCALRIFRVGMVNVIATLADSSKRGVKTIVVHESYGESAGPSGQDIEANNIGLVRISPGSSDYCLACLPDAGQLPRDNCTTVSFSPSKPLTTNCSTNGSCEGRATNMNDIGGTSCKGPSRIFRDDHGFSYISLACDTPWPMTRDIMPSKPWGKGAPLFCDGVLAGVEASVGTGAVVYTPLSHYLEWLDHNTHPGLPEQYFNLG